jgi:hypothetical protein
MTDTDFENTFELKHLDVLLNSPVSFDEKTKKQFMYLGNDLENVLRNFCKMPGDNLSVTEDMMEYTLLYNEKIISFIKNIDYALDFLYNENHSRSYNYAKKVLLTKKINNEFVKKGIQLILNFRTFPNNDDLEQSMMMAIKRFHNRLLTFLKFFVLIPGSSRISIAQKYLYDTVNAISNKLQDYSDRYEIKGYYYLDSDFDEVSQFNVNDDGYGSDDEGNGDGSEDGEGNGSEGEGEDEGEGDGEGEGEGEGEDEGHGSEDGECEGKYDFYGESEEKGDCGDNF